MIDKCVSMENQYDKVMKELQEKKDLMTTKWETVKY